MVNMFELFKNEVEKHFTEEESKLIMKAYHFAQIAHEGKQRASGEPYFIHPEHVAFYIMRECHLYDASSVCASLLHDTIEDTEVTKEDLIREFNEDIANLVEGVTNCNTISFENKTEEEKYNNSLVLQSLLKDIREAYIKLSDRLHNMLTLEYKGQKKSYAKAIQTFLFYVPLAYGIKASEVAKELEDLCFKYLFPEDYIHTENLKKDFSENYKEYCEELVRSITQILEDRDKKEYIEIHMKNLYGIYTGLRKNHKLHKIEDLITLKIVVKEESDCYEILKLLQEHFVCDELSISDQLIKTELDGYQAITLTMKGFKKYKVKVEIFTEEMAEFNHYGYAIIASKQKEKSFMDVQKELSIHSSFLNSILDLQQKYQDHLRLVEELERKFLSEFIRVYTPIKEIIILPEGATVLDFAYRIHHKIGESAIGASVNGQMVDVDFVLKDQDEVEIIKDLNVKRTIDEVNFLKTNRARRRILESLREDVPKN